MARTDVLTGLPNRRSADAELRRRTILEHELRGAIVSEELFWGDAGIGMSLFGTQPSRPDDVDKGTAAYR